MASIITSELYTAKITWTIKNFNIDDIRAASNPGRCFDSIEGPIFTTQCGKIEYTVRFLLKVEDDNSEFDVITDIKPQPFKYKVFYELNKDRILLEPDDDDWQYGSIEAVDELTVYLEIYNFVHQKGIIQPSLNDNLTNKLKNIIKDNSALIFTIKCKDKEFKVIKPLLADCSPVFKAMFESNLKEAQENCVEIVEFDIPEVQTMIDYCENLQVSDITNPIETFKIAHKYQIQELADQALAKLAENVNFQNLLEYLQLAETYDLKKFRDLCLKNYKY